MIKSIISFINRSFTSFVEMKLEDKLKSLIAILAVGKFILYIFGLDEGIDPQIWEKIKQGRYIFGALGIVLLFVILFSDSIEEKRKEWIMRRRHLTGAIISKRISKLEFMDHQGKKVRYFEKVHINKFDKDTQLVSTMVTDEKVEESCFEVESIQLNNCSFQSLNGNKLIKIRIENYDKKTEKNPLKTDDFCCYSVDFINSFIDKKGDSWEIKIDNYTKEYIIKIIFPSAKKIKSVVLYKKEENEIEKIEENGVAPILLHGVSENSIFLNLVNLDRKTTYILRWLYN